MQVDRPVPAGVQRQQRRRRLCRRVVVELTRDEHDAAREESLLQPVTEAHVSSVQGGPTFLTPNLGPKRNVRYRLRILGFVVLVGALIGYANFGALHPRGSGYRPGPIHYYDAFHYFMGAKYIPEVGYSGPVRSDPGGRARPRGPAGDRRRSGSDELHRATGRRGRRRCRPRAVLEGALASVQGRPRFLRRTDRCVARAAPRSGLQRSAAAGAPASRAGRSAARDVPDLERADRARLR